MRGREVVSVQPQISGQITKIHFHDGADVKVGDPLFTIDPRPFRATLALAEGSLAQEPRRWTWRRPAFARGKRLLPNAAIARTDYDQLENAVEVAAARVKSALASVDTARSTWSTVESGRRSTVAPGNGWSTMAMW